ncbi:acetyl-CoA synthetase-like protein [Xylaria intraflava]|nr:acetyl-CoA synthetase-like protein [Xylaria intraflava]
MRHCAIVTLTMMHSQPNPRAVVLSDICAALHTSISLLDLNSSFVHNGGDSLSSIQLQTALRKKGIWLSTASIFGASSLLQLIDCTKCEILQNDETFSDQSALLRAKRAGSFSHETPPKRPRTVTDHRSSLPKEKKNNIQYPMTDMQLSLIRSTKINPGYNFITYYEVHPACRVSSLKQAWKKVLLSEPIFRMSLEISDSGGYLIENDDPPFEWEEKIVEQEPLYHEAIKKLPDSDTILGSSFKVVTLLRENVEAESTIIWTVHHSLIDGFSFSRVRSKVEDVLSGRKTRSGPSFGDFSLQLQEFQRQSREAGVKFWAQQALKHPRSPKDLVFFPKSDGSSPSCHTIDCFSIQPKFTELEAHARKIGVTTASLYFAAWALVLSRYADSDHVCFGAVLSGRTLPFNDIESIIGPLINTLPYQVSIDHQSSVEDYARLVFASLLELTSFQWTTSSMGFSRNFSSALNIRLEPPSPSDSAFRPLEEPYSKVISDIPLNIDIGPCGRIDLKYDTGSFSMTQMESLGTSFGDALDLLLQPDLLLGNCLDSLLGSKHRLDLARLGNWNSDLTRSGSVKDTLVSLFERAAEAEPSSIAVQDSHHALSYADLRKKSSIIAQNLAKLTSPGDVVCVHADGTANWIISIYAVMMVGATYCPLDKSLPNVARDTNFRTSGAEVFLVGDKISKSAKPASCEICISIDELLDENDIIDINLSRPLPTSNAYICFTSGSTGKPKGVVCRHESIVALQRNFDIRLRARPGWKIAQVMSPGFDGSIHEIFSALSYGATLVLKDAAKPFDHLHRSDAVLFTPSVAQSLDPSDFPNLEAVYLVGEPVPQDVCDTWGLQTKLFNMYGPTEATCGATIKALVPGEPVTLGNPYPSIRVYILDSHGRVAPWGVVGEIHLAGIQAATGYMEQPDETARRFLSDSVNPQFKGEYMYKTGDRAYWNEYGELMYLGRSDRQIKLRGFRIDLNDLEIQIVRAIKDCTAAAVTTNGDAIIAAVQPSHLDAKLLRSKLLQHIPPYALPSRIVAVETFPMTPVGKLDYKAIAASTCVEASSPSPEHGFEEVVTESLRYVLAIPQANQINVELSFYDVGGNSIHALSLSHRLSKILGQRVSTGLILGSASIKDLIQDLEALKEPETPNLENTMLGDVNPSPIESEWWHKYQVHTNTSAFNVSYACHLSDSVNIERMLSAWDVILGRHRLLSCRFERSKTQGLVRKHTKNPPTAIFVNSIDINNEVNIPFNLEDDCLIRVSISPEHMLVVISHILCDLTTLGKLLQEVADVYHGKQLPPVTKTYYQTCWTSRPSAQQLRFWSSYLDLSPQVRYSIGAMGTRKTSWRGSSYIRQMPRALCEGISRFSSERKVTLHQIALAAVAVALQYDDDKCDVTLGAPYLNRSSEEDFRVVGLFLEPLPIRIQYPRPSQRTSQGGTIETHSPEADAEDPDAFIRAVQRSSRDALAHAMPWDQLLSHLNVVETQLPDNPMFDVMVTFHEAAHEAQLPIEGVRFVRTWADGAKFKLMAEFTAGSNGDADLRLEYSDECFTGEDVKLLADLVFEALEGLIQREDYASLRGRLSKLRGGCVAGSGPAVGSTASVSTSV